MVRAEDALHLYRLLTSHGIRLWLVGGWGIDALLGRQTRTHKDLDVLLLLDDMVRMRQLLELEGFSLLELWSENRWAVDGQGVETATALVLQDADGRQLDAHALWLDELGNGIPAWEAGEGFIFTAQDLSGQGVIASVPVPCITPQMQAACHTGYALPDHQRRDLELLHEKFGD